MGDLRPKSKDFNMIKNGSSSSSNTASGYYSFRATLLMYCSTATAQCLPRKRVERDKIDRLDEC